jgi:uncharacterized protein
VSRPVTVRKRLVRGLGAGALAALALFVGSAKAIPTELFISEYIEGSGQNKALEIYNGTGAPVDLLASGYSVFFSFNGGTSTRTIALTGTVASGDVYVIAQATANPSILAQADQTDTSTSWFNGDDFVALRKNGVTVDGIGQLGIDPGTEWGSGLTSTADNTLRRKPTIEAGDTNEGDAFDPSVEWDGFATDNVDNLGRHLGDDPPAVESTNPASGAANVPLDANITVTFTEDVTVSSGWYMLTCGGVAKAAAESGGPRTFTLDPVTDFAQNEACAVAVFGDHVSDQDTSDPPDNMTGNHGWTFTAEGALPPLVRIHDIQGAAHVSPLVGEDVTVRGVVTAKRTNGYYMQDPSPDESDATSEGILVFTGSAPAVSIGDSVRVVGRVAEFRPGGASSTNLSVTQITSPSTSLIPSIGSLPAPAVVGTGGRIPPTTVIEDDAVGSVETGGTFDPATDGIDFYESLEGMRLQINEPVVVGPRNSNGEIFVLADNGAGASLRTARGGIVIRDLGAEPPGDYASGDFNPERIQLDDAAGTPTPAVHVGDGFTGPAIGVLDFDFGNFEVHLTSALTRVDNGLVRETTAAPGPRELAVATFNVENLSPVDSQTKFDALAAQIVTNMRAPDVVSLEEIQDNSGPTNNGVVAADETLNRLVAAIQAAGGPAYDWRQIDPVNNQDGGQPGGNIRVGFLFRTDRGLAFVDRPGGDSTTPTTIVSGPDGPELSVSPGRIDPANTAWNASRKPLAGEFTFRGERFFLITNHFSSKGGDQPLFGRFQPPARITETQRHSQAQVVNGFVDEILALDPNANVVVLGDINDFEFSQTMVDLEGGVLHALMSTLPPDERYSYVFEGNSQSLDHIVVSDSLFGNPFAYDPVHVNAEFFDQPSDHDPQVARFLVDSAPSADAGGPYSVEEGSSVLVSATGTDANDDSLTFAWDLDDDGTFETPGQSTTFSAAALDGPSSHTVTVRVSDGESATTAQATVSVTNVAPMATFEAPASAPAGFPFTLALTNPSDPSLADTAAGFTYAFDCGDGSGFGAFSSSASRSCPTSATGTLTVRGKIRDEDGGVREYTASVAVVVTTASLCDLVHEFSSKLDVADALCEKLEEGALRAFRNQVDAQTGKAFTDAEAEILIDLSRDL